MVSLGPILAALLASQAPAPVDGTFVITSSAAEVEARRPARLLSSFLRDRIFESYGVSAGVAPSEVTRFELRTYFGSTDAFAITVLEGKTPLGARQFERSDPEAALFEAWIFVRAVLEEAYPPPGLMPEPVSAAPPSPPAPAGVEVASPPVAPLRDRSVAVLGYGALFGPETFGLGLAVQGRAVLGDRLSGGLELAYRRVDPLSAISVAHLPVSLLLGYELDPAVPLELGVRATLEPRLVMDQAQSDLSLGLGLLLGPYARVSVPFESVAFVGQVDLQAGLLRQAYTLGSERAVDPLLSLRVALGVEYRWP